MKKKASRNLLISLGMVMTQMASADTEIGLKTFVQYYQGLISNLAIDPVPDDLVETFKTTQSRLPQSGRVVDMNSAVPAAQLMLAHKACRIFVTQEMSRTPNTRLAFNLVDFKAPLTSLSPDTLRSATANLGNLVLMDPLSSAQQTDLVPAIQKIAVRLKGRSDAVSVLMTETCSLVVSSLGALVM